MNWWRRDKRSKESSASPRSGEGSKDVAEIALRQTDMVAGLLAEYTMGALSEPARVLVESHLELSAEGRRWVSDLEVIADSVAPSRAPHVFDTIEPVAFTDRDAALASMLDKIDSGNEAQELPRALRDFIGMKLEDIPWKKRMPGFADCRLPDVDGCEISLLRIDGGKTVPVHTHHGSEITLVLQGGFTDAHGHYERGDIAYADDHVNHKPVADEGEVCICFAVVDAPLELTGPLGRLINPFIR